MTYNPIVQNLAMDYQPDIINSNITLTSWARQLYDVSGSSSGTVTITLPPQPYGVNLVEAGSIFFRRLDTDYTRIVQVNGVLGGVSQNIIIPPGSDTVHWFMSVFDGGAFYDTFYYQLNPRRYYEDLKPAKIPVLTISDVNLNVADTNYIGRTISGVQLFVDDRFLLSNQTNQVENGCYVVLSGGGIARSEDAKAGMNGDGNLFPIQFGDFSGYVFLVKNATDRTSPAIYGVHPIQIGTWADFQSSSNQFSTRFLTADANLTFSDSVVWVSAILNPVTVTLPPQGSSGSSLFTTKKYTIGKIDASTNTVTVRCSGSDTFYDGTQTRVLQEIGEVIDFTAMSVSVTYAYIYN